MISSSSFDSLGCHHGHTPLLQDSKLNCLSVQTDLLLSFRFCFWKWCHSLFYCLTMDKLWRRNLLLKWFLQVAPLPSLLSSILCERQWKLKIKKDFISFKAKNMWFVEHILFSKRRKSPRENWARANRKTLKWLKMITNLVLETWNWKVLKHMWSVEHILFSKRLDFQAKTQSWKSRMIRWNEL